MLTPILVLSVALQAREPGSEVDRMATQERLDQPGWWPTKLLPSRKDLVGPQACVKCHPAISASAKDSEMAKALLRPEDSEVLRNREGQGFQLESYVYKLQHRPQSYEFSVRQGPDSSTQPITWAFGDGSISQVYVTDVHGTYYESHFSYYGGTDGFDRTTNQPHRAESLQSAVGRSMMPVEIRNCFSCHSAGVTSKGDFNNVIPGVTCEACHGPGADHVAAMKAGVEGGEGMIMNPGRLDRTASVDFCGACHMTWIDVQMGDVKDEASVRFPAYRLENSRCWAKGDKRITCVGCHDPHQPVVRDSTFYDQKCLGCHLATAATKPSTDHIGKACPQSDRDCISCHMPKREFPDTHHSFTDHYIRVVRTSAAAAGR